MEPQYVNNTLVDQPALLAWNRAEVWGFQRWYLALSAAMLAVCAGVAAGFVYMGATSHLSFFWVCAGVVVLLIALQLASLWLRPRLYVRSLMRQDEGRNYPASIRTLFYEDKLTVLRLRDGGPALAEDDLETLQREFAALQAEGDNLDMMEPASLERLRGQLEALQARLDALGRAAGGIVFQRDEAYSAITGCLVTEEMMILYFGPTAVLLRWDGFAGDTAAGFAAFMRGKLAAALAAAPDKRSMKNLAAALEALAGRCPAKTEKDPQ